jgi:uncharacterized UPF0146 family protein
MTVSQHYESLVNYIADRYGNAVEIGIGHFPDVALDLLERGVQVFATDVHQFQYKGLKVITDDITEPDLSAYTVVDLFYSLRPPPELIPYMVCLAKRIPADLIVKPLASEYPGGQLIRHGNTSFYLWSFR